MADDLSLALRDLQENKFRAARKKLRGVLARQPDNLQAMHALGITHLRMGKLAQAERIICKAIQAQPGLAFGHNNLGEVYRSQGKPEMAAASFRKALVVDPGMSEAHYNLGMVLEQMGQLEDAVACYRNALSITPNDVQTNQSLAGALRELGRLEEAETALRAAIAANPRQANLYNNLGIVLLGQDRFDEAIASYQEAIRLAPELSSAHSNLGVALKLSGRIGEAIASHEEAVRLAPQDARARQNHADALFELGHTDEALALYEKALALDPGNADNHYKLAGGYRNVGRKDEAIAGYRKALAIRPDHAEALRQLVNSTKQTADSEDIGTMQALYDQAGCAPHQKMHLAFGLGKAFEDLEQYEEAFAYFQAANRLKRETLSYSPSETADYFRALREAFSADLFPERGKTGLDSELPVFILGMPRSGTSLVEQILASHPEVYAAGELEDLGAAISSECDGKSTPFPAVIRELEDTAFGRMAANYLERLRLRPIGDARRVTDKMPHNFQNVGLISLMFPAARIVHIRRDPMDTCFSIYANIFSVGHSYAYDLAELGAYYRLYESLMEHWRQVLPGRMFEISYEALTGEPEEQTRRLLEHCGLEFDRRCLDFHETDRAVTTASSWQVREPLYRSSVARWRRYENWLEPLRKALEG